MIVASITTLVAQERGDMFVGSTIGFSYSDQSDVPNTLNIGASPEFCYFICNNFRIGITGSYVFQHQNVDNEGNYKSHSFGIGPTISYYVKMADKFYFTPEITGTFTWEYIRFKPSESSSNPYYISSTAISTTYTLYRLRGKFLGVSPFQIEIHPTDNIGISANLFSITASYYDDRDNKDQYSGETLRYYNGFKVDLGFTPIVGFMYYFGKNAKRKSE